MTALTFLAGCKVVLYSDIEEQDANAILAVLQSNGIDTEKTAGKENKWSLFIDKSNMVEAMTILEERGYPREKFVSAGEVFKKEGLVSTPMEERVRFIYAVSQELSATISEIDGVLAARTHIVLPDNDPFSEKIIPSSAAVFIKHTFDADIESRIPQIKKLVVNSIEGLSYENVSVILFPSKPVTKMAELPNELVSVLGIKVTRASVGVFLALLATLAITLAGTGGGLAFVLLSRSRSLKSSKGPVHE